jgi:hypothetical protein
LAGTLDRRSKWVGLSFKDNRLNISAGESSCIIDANGDWPSPVSIEATWVRSWSKLLPEDDRIILRAEDGRFYANSLSKQCRVGLPKRPVPTTQVSITDRQNRIEKAAKLLGPFQITPEDLEILVDRVEARGTSSWLRKEKAMIALTAKAWTALAPLGIETGDLRAVIDEGIRAAFSRKKV